MNFKTFAALLAIGLLAGSTAFAAEFLAPDREGGSVTVGSGQAYRNLYTVGANVNINGPIAGDLYAAGSAVTVNGNVERDLTAAGGNMNVNGTVGGNVHVAGGNISFNNAVAGDLLVAGGSITVAERASIAGDLVVAGGNVTIDGPVSGNIRVSGGTVNINGRVAGNVYARTTESLVFGSRSEVVGTVYLKSPREAVLREGARVPNVEYTRVEMNRGDARDFGNFGWIISIIAWFIVGWLLTRFARRFSANSARTIQSSFWKSLGIGLLFLIASPIVIVLLFFTVVGYFLAILGILFYVFVLMISAIMAAVFVGSWLWGLFRKSQKGRMDWLTVLVGVLAVKIVSLIPVIGWLAVFILFLAAVGSVVRNLGRHWRTSEEQTSDTTPPPPPARIA